MGDSATTVLQDIVEILVGGIQGVAQGVGSGMQTLMESIFLVKDATNNTYSLSVFGGVIIIFAGIA